MQWINLQRNSSFVNWTRFPLLCEKSGAIFLSASGPYGRPAGKLASDKTLVDLKIKFSTDRIVWIFMEFNECVVLITVLPMVFWIKYIVRHVMEVCKSWTPRFLYY